MKRTSCGFFSLSGGVGRSTLAKETAGIIASTRIDGIPVKTCLVDAKLCFGSQASYFGIVNPRYTIADFFKDHEKNLLLYSPSELLKLYGWSYMQKYLSYIKERELYILPSCPELSGVNADLAAGQALFAALERLFDVVVIDTAADFSPLTMAAFTASDNIYFVLTDDETVIRCQEHDYRRILSDTGLMGKAKASGAVVYNKYIEKTDLRYMDVYEIEKRIGLPVAVTVPQYDDLMFINNRKLVSALGTNSPIRDAVYRLAGDVVPEVNGL